MSRRLGTADCYETMRPEGGRMPLGICPTVILIASCCVCVVDDDDDASTTPQPLKIALGVALFEIDKTKKLRQRRTDFNITARSVKCFRACARHIV